MAARSSFLFFAIALMIAGCSSTSSIGKKQPVPRITELSRSSHEALKARIDSILSDTLFPPANVGIKVVSLATGETLYELNPDMLFIPGSNEKLFTSACALVSLGKDFPFTTRVYVDSASKRIFIKGSGDPMLSTDDLDSLACLIERNVQHQSAWTLVGDVSYFDSVYWGHGWMWDDEQDDYNMAISPLSINANALTVQVRPGKLEDSPVHIQTIPTTNYVFVENEATTVVDSPLVALNISRNVRERSNIILITGQMLKSDSLIERHLSIWQPERYALTLLAERLEAHGFAVKNIELDTVSSVALEKVHISHTLDSVVTFMNKESDNLSAENILKTLSAERNGEPGTSRVGVSITKRFLDSLGVDTTRCSMVDGSGLSRYNFTSPNVVVRLLGAMAQRSDVFETFYASLPIAGVDGTLSDRMKGTSAEGNLRAKTGTLSGASALSGYVRDEDGEMLGFSILMNNYASSAKSYRIVQDRIGALLSQLRRSTL